MLRRIRVVTKLQWPSFKNVAKTVRHNLSSYCECTIHDANTVKPGGNIIFIGTADTLTIHSIRRLVPESNVLFYAATEGLSRLDETDLETARYLRIVAVSNFAKEMMEKSGLAVAGVIHHGIDMRDLSTDAQFYRTLKKKLRDRKVILTVSANHLRKGLDHLLSAHKIVEEQTSDAFLVLHSQRRGYCDLVSQGKQLGLNRIWFTNKFGRMSQRKLNALYKLCTLYVQPSLSEGFGLPILEAFRFNKPPIAVNAPPFDEIITHGRTGILFPLKEVTWSPSESIDFRMNEYAAHDMAKAIVMLLENQEQVAEISRRIATENSNWEAKRF